MLPDDLKWLTTQGLSQPAIFKLMGLATQNNKRLSDITAATLPALSKLQGNALYAYLRVLIDGPQDFALAAKQQRQRCQDKEQYRRQTQQDQAFRERFAGVSCFNKEHTRLYQLDHPSAGYLSVVEKNTTTLPIRRVSPLNAEWISFLKTGLDQGQLILATEAIEATWQANHQGIVHNTPHDTMSDGYTLSNPTNSIKNKTIRHRKWGQIGFNDQQAPRPIHPFVLNCGTLQLRHTVSRQGIESDPHDFTQPSITLKKKAQTNRVNRTASSYPQPISTLLDQCQDLPSWDRQQFKRGEEAQRKLKP